MRQLISKLLQNLVGPLGILSLGVLIAALFMIFKSHAPSLPPEEQAWPIEVMEVSPQSYHPEVLLYGRVESRQKTTLKAAVTAYVQDTPALEGQEVADQALVLALDPRDALLLLEQREAEVAGISSELLAEKNRKSSDEETILFEKELIKLLSKSVEREQELTKKKLGSQSRVEEAELGQIREKISIASRELALKNYEARLAQLEANLAKAKADRDLADLNAKRTQIKAPFSGIISQRFVSIGDRVQPNDALLEMYSTEHLEIRAQVSTDRLELLSEALNKKIPVKAELMDKEKTVSIELNRLAGEIEQAESGIDALFVIDSKQAPLRLGEVVKLKALLPEVDSVIALPSASLFESENKKYVYQVHRDQGSDRLKAIPVQVVGERFDGLDSFILIQGAIEAQSLILTTRLPYARDGLKVEIREN